MMESISMRHLYEVAKVFGSVLCISGALLVAFNESPPVKFMIWYSTAHKEDSSLNSSAIDFNSKLDWIKGPLTMLLANTAWSMWLIMQVSLVALRNATIKLACCGPLLKIYPAKICLTKDDVSLAAFYQLFGPLVLIEIFHHGNLVGIFNSHRFRTV
ncbi:hypothetical protein IFM89_029468 [Coptis chinensis]|uniref:Uncharacterized protein n=1 Tax=Coptis chinensis TaxID=261450 RepID=A0A835HX91_9MAGN|nr:hypothetical protein IFM89_029468 [Coptis chinensis]